MKTILVPTDFSLNATNALNYAAGLVNLIGGKLIIVHTINLPVTPLDGAMVVSPIGKLAAEYQQELDQQAEELTLNFHNRFTIETQCLFGDLLTNLDVLIKEKAVDLVIMGSRGASNILNKIIGTNTANFIKKATCPVLAVPANVQFKGINKIAYASDFEGDETIFLQQLFALAEPFHCEVSVINILPERHQNIFSDNHVIRNIIAQFPDNKYSIAQIQESDIIKGIDEFVEDNNPDVLAVSIHTRSLLEDLFHKSITKELFYQMHLPLLALPEKPYRQPLHKPATQVQRPVSPK